MKELAPTVAMLVDQPVQAVYQKARMHELLDVDRTVYAWGVIDAEAPLDALAALTLSDDELDKLAKASPGSEWNLSGPGFASIRSIAESLREARLAERRVALMQGYRDLLAEPVKASLSERLVVLPSSPRPTWGPQPCSRARGSGNELRALSRPDFPPDPSLRRAG